MAYFDFSIPIEVRIRNLTQAIDEANCLGMQLVWLFELFLCMLYMRRDLSDKVREVFEVKNSSTLHLNKLDKEWIAMKIPTGAVHALEDFRNSYVHNGQAASLKYFHGLTSYVNLTGLHEICKIARVQLDFTLPL